MATTKKPQLEIVLPKKLLSAARSRTRPTDQSEAGSELQSSSLFSLINNPARNYRNATNITELMRHLARAEGPFSSAVHNLVEVTNTGYSVSAYDAETHQFSPEGTSLAYSILAQWDTPWDYSGFTQKFSLDSTKQLMLREAVLTGGVASELVLTKALLPDRLQVVGMETLTWISDGKGGFYPGQRIAGATDVVSLNVPTFFASWVHPDPNTVAPRSMLEAALKMLVFFEEFMDDIRRVVRVSGHNRTKITLDAEKIKKTAPREVQSDPRKLAAYMEDVRAAVQQQLEQIDPEQALVMFDSVQADVIQSGIGTKVDYTPLLNVVVGQYATAMKTPPSVLGLRLESGSQALGNVETLMFLKSAKALHTSVETVISRALTLSCRLYGANVYIVFKFDPLDLRPEVELQAFYTMRQTRIMEMLSYGFITDDEAANMLGQWPRPPGAPALSGTFFLKNNGAADASNTFPGDTAMGRTMQPDKDVPRKGGGKSQ